MDDAKKQHLEFIQNVITRMNTNSFQIKGMAVTIVSALIAIYVSTSNILFVFLGIIPTLLFWFLDSYYLQQERKFRGVYNNVSGLKNDVEIILYEMPIHKFQGGQYRFCRVFFSKTIALLYATIIFLLLFCGLILKFKDCITVNC
ncbi:hypothetical protein FACS189432_03970 [Bacteroidia bacterium]|nr:hypothetical protein FACS189426_11010 [Bacteroidia bacterium]GHT27435.1 hypothetical protein FACS189432_03970 [Bacteroidia bacterium]GHV71105.1 hypothetical protein FACS189420_4930 [Bacteroidia bacterium]